MERPGAEDKRRRRRRRRRGRGRRRIREGGSMASEEMLHCWENISSDGVAVAVAETETETETEKNRRRIRRGEGGGGMEAEDILPNDCWEKIFDQLDDHYNSVSLVCKSFLSITDRMRRKLNFPMTDFYCYYVKDNNNNNNNSCPPPTEMINRLLVRFPCLEEIQLFTDHDSKKISNNRILNQFATTSFAPPPPAAAALNIKVLTCSVSDMDDVFLQYIGNSFQCVQELYLTTSDYCSDILEPPPRRRAITDKGVQFLTRKLKYLKKISLVGQLTDASLAALSSCTTSLTHLSLADEWITITARGISYLLAHFPNLVSLSLHPSICPTAPPDDLLNGSSITIHNSIACHGKNLQCLDCNFLANDSALSTIAAAKLDLQKISFNAADCTLSGLMLFLGTYHQSLSSLSIEDAEFLDDNSLATLLLNYPPSNLTEIGFHECPNLTNSSFLLLLKHCPSLSSIEMDDTSLGKGNNNFHKELFQNENIQKLKLLSNDVLDDSTLESIGKFCPNLKHVTLEPPMRSYRFTGKGMAKMLKRCNRIRVLHLSRDHGLRGPKPIHLSIGIPELPNLEELYVRFSTMSDEHLASIANSCRGLRILDIRLNKFITDSSILLVTQNCKRLKQINLGFGSRLSKDIKSKILVINPSLRVSIDYYK